MELTYSNIRQFYLDKGYNFNIRPFELNLLGIRNDYTATNAWDDKLVIAYNDGRENKVIIYKNYTTDPGFYFLKTKLLNPKGCAILAEGHYKGMFTVGKHQGKYEALVQRIPVTVYRDANKNNTLDKSNPDTGIFGINLHHGYNSAVIFNNSAGCQVLKNIKDLESLLVLAKIHEKSYGKGINYTLTSGI